MENLSSTWFRQKTKISAAVFIEHILKPIPTCDIPWLYGDQKHKVIFHTDSAPSHRAAITQEYFKQQKLKYIPAKEWMPYSSDMVPMERAINGNLKTNLKRRIARDRGQLIRAIRYEWSKIKILTIRRALESWRTRVEAMVKSLGDHVEHVLS